MPLDSIAANRQFSEEGDKQTDTEQDRDIMYTVTADRHYKDVNKTYLDKEICRQMDRRVKCLKHSVSDDSK